MFKPRAGFYWAAEGRLPRPNRDLLSPSLQNCSGPYPQIGCRSFLLARHVRVRSDAGATFGGFRPNLKLEARDPELFLSVTSAQDESP